MLDEGGGKLSPYGGGGAVAHYKTVHPHTLITFPFGLIIQATLIRGGRAVHC